MSLNLNEHHGPSIDLLSDSGNGPIKGARKFMHPIWGMKYAPASCVNRKPM